MLNAGLSRIADAMGRSDAPEVVSTVAVKAVTLEFRLQFMAGLAEMSRVASGTLHQRVLEVYEKEKTRILVLVEKL